MPESSRPLRGPLLPRDTRPPATSTRPAGPWAPTAPVLWADPPSTPDPPPPAPASASVCSPGCRRAPQPAHHGPCPERLHERIQVQQSRGSHSLGCCVSTRCQGPRCPLGLGRGAGPLAHRPLDARAALAIMAAGVALATGSSAARLGVLAVRAARRAVVGGLRDRRAIVRGAFARCVDRAVVRGPHGAGPASSEPTAKPPAPPAARWDPLIGFSKPRPSSRRAAGDAQRACAHRSHRAGSH